MKKKHIYLDYAAATPVAPDVLKAMQPYWSTHFGNASSLHSYGSNAKLSLILSRKSIASKLNCNAGDIIFTSGGTESINIALKGYVAAQKSRKQHIISTVLEHTATLETLKKIHKRGCRVTLAPCDANGVVEPASIINSITPNTALVSIILAQNEIGTIQPVHEIGKLLININRRRKVKKLPHIAFHVDAAQAPAFLECNVQKFHADLMTLDASKMYGPKGIGLLYIRQGTQLEPLFDGGGQENGLRSGTEPVALIVGFAAALNYVTTQRKRRIEYVTYLRDYAIKRIREEIPDVRITGSTTNRLANNIHATFADLEGESLVLYLDRAAIAASTGAACSTGDPGPSHVIKALNLPKRFQNGSLRLTMGYAITKKQVDYTVEQLTKIVAKLRKQERPVSP